MFTAQQCQMIEAMGLGPVWLSRRSVDPLLAPASVAATPATVTPAPATRPTTVSSAVTSTVSSTAPVERAPRTFRPREEGVDTDKVDAFMRRVKAPDRSQLEQVPEDTTTVVPVTPERYSAATTRDDLIALVKDEVSQLRPTLSPLVVFDAGDVSAPLVVVGVEPGANEMLNAQPFSGTALTLLEGMMGAIGLDAAQDTYQTTRLKYRRHHNEVLDAKREACADALLLAQLELTQAKALLFLGDDVANRFMEAGEKEAELTVGNRTITAIRSHSMTDLLRSPLLKADVWADLLRVKHVLTRVD